MPRSHCFRKNSTSASSGIGQSAVAASLCRGAGMCAQVQTAIPQWRDRCYSVSFSIMLAVLLSSEWKK